MTGAIFSEERATDFGRNCRSDAQGRWHYDSVPVTAGESPAGGEYKVEIDHPQFAPELRCLSRAKFECDPQRPAAARIVLKPGITVTGKVTDEHGSPIAGASIRTRLRFALREAVSGADGVYQLHGCEPVMTVLVGLGQRPCDRGPRNVDRPRGQAGRLPPEARRRFANPCRRRDGQPMRRSTPHLSFGRPRAKRSSSRGSISTSMSGAAGNGARRPVKESGSVSRVPAEAGFRFYCPATRKCSPNYRRRRLYPER